MKRLFLQDNELSGEIPAEYERLWEAKLSGNPLTGCVPDSLTDLNSYGFSYGNNPVQISYPENLPVCDASSHPGDEEALIAIYEALKTPIEEYWGPGSFDLLDNWLGRDPIGEWTGVSVDLTGRVVGLNLTQTDGQISMRGPLPPELFDLASLKWLWLGEGFPGERVVTDRLQGLRLGGFTGEVPTGKLVNLELVDFRGTQVCLPKRPDELKGYAISCREMEALIALNNSWLREITGVRTDETGRVTRLRISGSGFEGEIPPELGNLVNLESLILESSQLSGEIPRELGNLVNLQVLRLESNRLSGEIPRELGNLVNLESLILESNQLSGEIPPELGNLVNLQVLGLEWNQLSGEIPPELGNLSRLQLSVSDNQLSGCVPSRLRGRTYSDLPDC